MLPAPIRSMSRRRALLLAAVAALVLARPVLFVYRTGTVSWPALFAGAGLWILAFGPAPHTAVGRRFGRWFREIGRRGRLTAVLGFALVVWVASVVADPDPALVNGFVLGGIGPVFGTLAMRALWPADRADR